jgi:hypothetical protein
LLSQAFGTDTLQCRLAAARAFSDPLVSANMPLNGKVMCRSAGASGGALCAGADRTAGWAGTYHEVCVDQSLLLPAAANCMRPLRLEPKRLLCLMQVAGVCVPGKALGGCCCFKGNATVALVGHNTLRVNAGLDGTFDLLAC